MPVGLILIDIQNDYFPGGKMELEGSVEAGEAAEKLLGFFREHGRERKLPVFHIQHLSVRPGATFFLPDSAGVEIHPCVKPRDGETVIRKYFPNSFRETGLLQHLQREKIRQLVVAGMMTHMCVDATVRAAADYGYDCLIAHDACATRGLNFGGRSVSAPDVHASFLAALQGVYAKVLSADEIMAGLEKA